MIMIGHKGNHAATHLLYCEIALVDVKSDKSNLALLECLVVSE